MKTFIITALVTLRIAYHPAPSTGLPSANITAHAACLAAREQGSVGYSRFGNRNIDDAEPIDFMHTKKHCYENKK